MSNWTSYTKPTLDVAQTVAILVGAAWIYFKFIRGRTFARRAELDITADLVIIANRRVMKTVVKLKNTGLSKLPLKQDDTWVQLLATPSSSWVPRANFEWFDQMTSPIFADHKWIESQETVSDEVLMPVDQGERDPWLAFRIEIQVWGEPPWYRSTGTKWVAKTVVLAQTATATQAR